MKRLIIFTVCILTVGLLPLFFCGMHGLFESDFIGQQIPFILETKRMLASGVPFWSWNTHMGENFIATYSFYTITSPFVWLVCLFPAKYILWALLLSLYLKTICTAVFSYLYFKKMELSAGLSCIGALSYTFSSFFICNLFYFHFCEPVMVFPLLLIAIENFIAGTRQRVFWLAAATFAVVWINYYFAVCSLLLGALYFVFRAVGKRCFTSALLFKAVGSVLLGIISASVVLIPTALNIIGAPRVSATLSLHYYGPLDFCIRTLQRLFYLLFPAATEQGQSLLMSRFDSNEASIGVFGMLLAILYFYKKRDWAGWLVVTLLVFYFVSPLNAVFSMFSNYDYTRWLYGFILLGVLCSMKFIADGLHVSRRALMAYIVFSMGVLTVAMAFRWITNAHNFGLTTKALYELILITVNTLCLVVWASSHYNCRVLLWCVAVSGCANLCLFTTIQRREYVIDQSHGEYRDPIFQYIVDQPEGIASNANLYSHRTDFIARYRNNELALNRPSVASFHSLFNKNATGLRAVVDENVNNPTFLLNRNRTSLAALMSVKEVLVYDSIGGDAPSAEYFGIPRLEGMEYRCTVGGVDVYDFTYYVPMGFAYDSYVTENELQPAIADSLDVPLLMLDNLVISAADVTDLSRYLQHGVVDAGVTLDSLVNERRSIVCHSFAADSRGFKTAVDMPRTGVVFFSVPADDGFSA